MAQDTVLVWAGNRDFALQQAGARVVSDKFPEKKVELCGTKGFGSAEEMRDYHAVVIPHNQEAILDSYQQLAPNEKYPLVPEIVIVEAPQEYRATLPPDPVQVDGTVAPEVYAEPVVPEAVEDGMVDREQVESISALDLKSMKELLPALVEPGLVKALIEAEGVKGRRTRSTVIAALKEHLETLN
jgi:hypothetical protein